MRVEGLLILGCELLLRPGSAILPAEEPARAIEDEGVPCLPGLNGDCFVSYDGGGQVDGIPRLHLENEARLVKDEMPTIPVIERAKDQDNADAVREVLDVLVGPANRLRP